MGHYVINDIGCQVVDENFIEKLTDNNFHEFDSGEEVLLEMIVGEKSYILGDKTISMIENIVIPLVHRELTIPNHYVWRKYIFNCLGRIYNYVGEIAEIDSIKSLEIKLKETHINIIKIYDQMENVRKKIIAGKEQIKKPRSNEQIDLRKYQTDVYVYFRNNPLETEYHELMRQFKDYYFQSWYDFKNKIIPNYKFTAEVYKLSCDLTPNIIYVGQTQLGVENRVKQHLHNSAVSSSKLKFNWLNYINENNGILKWEVLEIADINDVHQKEKEWIAKFKKDKELLVVNYDNKNPRNDEGIIEEFLKIEVLST